MKIKLSSGLQYAVASECASIVHSLMVNMHLRRSWGIWEDGTQPNLHDLPQWRRDELQGVRAAVRSIRDKFERRVFVMQIKHVLKTICEERGTTRKWQDYVEGVKRAKADHDENIKAIAAAQASR